jgi:hypothetical protein
VVRREGYLTVVVVPASVVEEPLEVPTALVLRVSCLEPTLGVALLALAEISALALETPAVPRNNAEIATVPIRMPARRFALLTIGIPLLAAFG